jgi:addiction module HigA family antidote
MPTMSKSSTTTGERVFGPFHPGDVLREEFAKPLGIGAREIAAALHVDPQTIEALMQRAVPMTGDLALRLGRYFGTTARFWMNMQSHYDLEAAMAAAGERIEREVEPRA